MNYTYFKHVGEYGPNTDNIQQVIDTVATASLEQMLAMNTLAFETTKGDPSLIHLTVDITAQAAYSDMVDFLSGSLPEWHGRFNTDACKLNYIKWKYWYTALEAISLSANTNRNFTVPDTEGMRRTHEDILFIESLLTGARNAIIGLLTRDIIATTGYTQEHYDTLTLPWRLTIGNIHEDDYQFTEQEQRRCVLLAPTWTGTLHQMRELVPVLQETKQTSS